MNISFFNNDNDEYTLEDVMRSFQIFDEDHDGKLTLQELENAMTQFGDEDINYPSGNSKMNHEEFTQMKNRLMNVGLIEEYKYVNIEKLSRTFLGIPAEPDSPSVGDFE